jgi:ATP-dependent Clp protease adaptor protein ClpS
MNEDLTMVVEPVVRPKNTTKKKPKKQPRYNVILWDDSDHTYEYVQLMMKDVFRMPTEKGFQIAKQVDSSGRAICLTTTLEHAELKRDQIHAYGADARIPRCKGSMSASIEPFDGD